MATFSPVDPTAGFFDSGVDQEEIFETSDERSVSPSILFAETLSATPELAKNPIALAQIFRKYRETVLAPVQASHAQALDEAVTMAKAQARKHVQQEFATLQADADEQYTHGHTAGLRACGQTHAELIAQDYRARQAAMNSVGVQATVTHADAEAQYEVGDPMFFDASTQYEAAAPVVTRSFATETDPVPAEAPVVTRSFSIQTEEVRAEQPAVVAPVQQRTSRAAQVAFAALGMGVGVASTFTALYLGGAF